MHPLARHLRARGRHGSDDQEGTDLAVTRSILNDLKDGGGLSAKGNVVDHEYEIERDGQKIAEISKRWFRIRDTYGIEVAPGENDALIIAAAVCIDEMAGH